MPGERILVVDDFPLNLRLIRLVLATEKYEIRTLASAEDALQTLPDFRPRLVLADLQLPGMDGLELARRIKQNAETRDIVVVALTALSDSADERKAMEAGCDGYIVKPIDTRTFGATIRAFLDRAPVAASTTSGPALCPPSEEFGALCRRFQEDGLRRARQLLADLDGPFRFDEAGEAAHQWIGTASLLGFPAVARSAGELASMLARRPVDNADLRESLAALVAEFACPPAASLLSPQPAPQAGSVTAES